MVYHAHTRTAKPLSGDGLQRCPVKTDIHVNFTETFSDGIRVFMNGNRRTLPVPHGTASSLLLTPGSLIQVTPKRIQKMSGKRRYCHHCGEYVCRSTYFEHQTLVESSSKADSSLQAKQQLLAEGMYHMIDVH